eukprot:2020671-Prymnesium_polylepis.1
MRAVPGPDATERWGVLVESKGVPQASDHVAILFAIFSQSCRNPVAILSQSCRNRVAIASQSRRNRVAVASQSRRNRVAIASQSRRNHARGNPQAPIIAIGKARS